MYFRLFFQAISNNLQQGVMSFKLLVKTCMILPSEHFPKHSQSTSVTVHPFPSYGTDVVFGIDGQSYSHHSFQRRGEI